MFFGSLFISFDPLVSFFYDQSTGQIFLQLFGFGGWLLLVNLLFFVGMKMWVDFKESVATSSWKWVLLAVDIPLLNLQTPKAVEQMFTHLAGARDPANIAGKFWHGAKQKYFSFEIVSIDGYIQFLIRTETSFRDLVEAAVYSQYPETEIIEVEDYVTDIPNSFPNSTHDMWGADFALVEPDAYPIRTYEEFEHSISKDTQLKDPMSAFLESFSRLGTGEQMWFQIIIEPVGNDWKDKSIKKINELIGDTTGEKKGDAGLLLELLSYPFAFAAQFIEQLADHVLGREPSASEASAEKKDVPNKVQYLTPGQKNVVESIENKISKIGFKTKMRGMYIARKEVFNISRGVNALIGAIGQYNNPSANSLVPKFDPHMSYLWKKQRSATRKGLLMKAYKKRKSNIGANPYILNIEELATIWHFPMSYVKTPLLQKTAGKRSEPPASLPIEQIIAPPTVEEKEAVKPMRFG